jgi:NAD(P)-dependent dehydrogenase (short-subunit alcohol dehydrogenase family)
MTDKKTWFITGAGRGMGVDFAKAALAAGHNVVATGRNPDTVTQALGDSDDLLAVKLDVTSPHDAETAVKAAVDRFGAIDVLVNNAGNFYAGHFEELTPEQVERQLATSLIGPMNVSLHSGVPAQAGSTAHRPPHRRRRAERPRGRRAAAHADKHRRTPRAPGHPAVAQDRPQAALCAPAGRSRAPRRSCENRPRGRLSATQTCYPTTIRVER